MKSIYPYTSPPRASLGYVSISLSSTISPLDLAFRQPFIQLDVFESQRQDHPGICRPPRELRKSSHAASHRNHSTFALSLLQVSPPFRLPCSTMAFPGGAGMMPGAMNPNAGMSEQEQQMVKAVCDPSTCADVAMDLRDRAIACRT